MFAHVLAKRLRHGIVHMVALGTPSKVVMVCKEEQQVSIWEPTTMSRTDVAAPVLPDGVKNIVTRLTTCGKQVWAAIGERYLWLAEPAATIPLKTEHLQPILALASTVRKAKIASDCIAERIV